MDRTSLGWSEYWKLQFDEFAPPGCTPARIAREERAAYFILTDIGEQLARVSGRLRAAATRRADFPAVGDWVAVSSVEGEGAVIQSVLPRRTLFSRRSVGEGAADEQVIAANLDTVFLVSGLDGDFNPRRIERYLTLAWESGAAPVVVLNKADLCPNFAERVAMVEELAPGTPVHAVSAAATRGAEALRPYLGPGTTTALLGSSGVGKSSLINVLLGTARQRTAAVRADDQRGRHTTTRREMLLLPTGGVLIDTPGMRELQLWADAAALDQVFADVTALAEQCRFHDCRHEVEPGCAVRAALAAGTLAPARYASYVKLGRELSYQARRDDVRLWMAERERWKKLGALGRARARRKL